MELKKLLAAIILLMGVTVLYSQAWTQVGDPINGDAEWDKSGFKVSISGDGNTIAVSAIENDTKGYNAGQVKVFRNDNENWVQTGNDLYGDVDDEDFGLSLDLNYDGTVLAVGTPQYQNSGIVKVFKYSNGDWVQMGTYLGDRKGAGISLELNYDGTVIAVGTRTYTYGMFNGVMVYKYDKSSGSWGQLGDDIKGGSDGLGYSVSINSKGDIIAMGGFDDYNIEGHVEVFQYKEDEELWKIVGDVICGENSSDMSGWSVSLNSEGNILAIGAPGNDDNGEESGYTRVFKNVSGTWTQIGDDINGDSHKHSGRSVMLNSDGSIVAIGSPVSDGYNTEKDHVSIYQFKDGTWKLFGEKIYETEAYSYFGDAVSLSADGFTVAVGAFSSDANGEHSGQTRIYTYGESLGMNDKSVLKINIFPNPVSDILYLNYNKSAVPDPGNVGIEIYSVTGQKVKVIDHTTDKIDISELSKGIYLINLVTDKGIVTRKFVVAR